MTGKPEEAEALRAKFGSVAERAAKALKMMVWEAMMVTVVSLMALRVPLIAVARKTYWPGDELLGKEAIAVWVNPEPAAGAGPVWLRVGVTVAVDGLV